MGSSMEFLLVVPFDIQNIIEFLRSVCLCVNERGFFFVTCVYILHTFLVPMEVIRGHLNS